MYTHSVSHAHFLCTFSLRDVQTSRARLAQDVCSAHVMSLHLVLSILMFHPPLLFPHGHFDTTFPSAPSSSSFTTPKSAGQAHLRTSAGELGYLADPHALHTLAVIQPIWVQQLAEEFSSFDSVPRHFAGYVDASVGASDIEKEGPCPTSCTTSPMIVGLDRSVRNWSIYQGRSLRWVGFHGQALASVDQQVLARTQRRKSGGENLEIRLHCRSNIVHDGDRRFGDPAA